MAIASEAAISKSVMPVKISALPWTICSQSTSAARDGAARKKALIQPARTEASSSASAPKIQNSRQAVSRALSGIDEFKTIHQGDSKLTEFENCQNQKSSASSAVNSNSA